MENGLGRRIVKDVVAAADDRDYYYNEAWQRIVDATGASVKAIYAWHPEYVDSLAVRMRPAAGGADEHFFTHDALYNVTSSVSDANDQVVERYHYSPYGEAAFLTSAFAVQPASTIGQEHLYTGRERDPETGLQLNRHRWYHAALGRWVSRDPIGYDGGLNLFEYVNSDPIWLDDPWGLQPEEGKEERSELQQCFDTCTQKDKEDRRLCRIKCMVKNPPDPEYGFVPPKKGRPRKPKGEERCWLDKSGRKWCVDKPSNKEGPHYDISPPLKPPKEAEVDDKGGWGNENCRCETKKGENGNEYTRCFPRFGMPGGGEFTRGRGF